MNNSFYSSAACLNTTLFQEIYAVNPVCMLTVATGTAVAQEHRLTQELCYILGTHAARQGP